MSQVPDILTVKPFAELREQFIEAFFIPYATEKVGKEQAQQIAQGLRSPNEVASLLLDCMVLYRQQETRNDNHRCLQNFSETVTESAMIDLIVSDLGLERQVITPADNTVFPAVPAVMESDTSLLLRYSLAPYGLAVTGTRLGYKHHCLTAWGRPLMSVEAESENVVVMRYEFQPDEGIVRPKDAAARMVEPHTGKINIRLLSFEGDGTASDELCDSVKSYLSREDIGQEANDDTVESAEIMRYTIDVDVKYKPQPNQVVDKAALDADLQAYANQQHKLKGSIQHSVIHQIAHNHKASKITINQPSETAINCEWYQAPFCTGVTSRVEAEQEQTI